MLVDFERLLQRASFSIIYPKFNQNLPPEDEVRAEPFSKSSRFKFYVQFKYIIVFLCSSFRVIQRVCYTQNSISLVIRQKGESQNKCFRKTKQAKFSEKQTFLNPFRLCHWLKSDIPLDKTGDHFSLYMSA